MSVYIKSHNSHCMSGHKPSHEVQGTLCRPLWEMLWWGKDKGRGVSQCSQEHSDLKHCEIENVWNHFSIHRPAKLSKKTRRVLFRLWRSQRWLRASEAKMGEPDWRSQRHPINQAFNGKIYHMVASCPQETKTRSLNTMSEHQSLLIIWLIPFVQWSMAVALSCCGVAYQWQKHGDWSEIKDSCSQIQRSTWRKPVSESLQPGTGVMFHILAQY